MPLGSIRTEMQDAIAKIKMAIKSPDNDEKHLALIHLDHKLPIFSEAITHMIEAVNSSMTTLEKIHERKASLQAYKAELGASEWEAFMPEEWQVLNTVLRLLGEYRK